MGNTQTKPTIIAAPEPKPKPPGPEEETLFYNNIFDQLKILIECKHPNGCSRRCLRGDIRFYSCSPCVKVALETINKCADWGDLSTMFDSRPYTKLDDRPEADGKLLIETVENKWPRYENLRQVAAHASRDTVQELHKAGIFTTVRWHHLCCFHWDQHCQYQEVKLYNTKLCVHKEANNVTTLIMCGECFKDRAKLISISTTQKQNDMLTTRVANLERLLGELVADKDKKDLAELVITRD